MEINAEILRRYFAGKYSRKDFQQIKTMFFTPSYRIELRKHLKQHWLEYVNDATYSENPDHIFEAIQQRIRRDERNQRKMQLVERFRRVAAILIVPLLLAFLAVVYYEWIKEEPSLSYAEIQCPLGVRTKFQLPDGTEGYLNSGSVLKYPVIFEKIREVTLQGEAFFDVHHSSKPFVVSTPNLEIEVLGTRFNVIAYGEENSEEVILENGKVQVTSISGSKSAVLHPDQKLILSKTTNRFRKKAVEAAQYRGWTEGMLIFRNENMEQVAKRLGRWYNAEISIRDEDLLKYAFRATFIDEPLEEVLRLLAHTAPLEYEIMDREKTTNNVYKRKKVLIKLDRERADAF